MIRGLALIFLLVFISPVWASENILIYGDSLSAAYGIRIDAAWPVLLDSRLKQEGYKYEVINASISGETTSGGLSRLHPILERHKPSIVVILLGCNDGLRGLPIKQMRENLVAMINASKKVGAKVLLVGQRLPSNYGNYANQFHSTFGEVAKVEKTAHVDFLLNGIAERMELFLPNDIVHPNAEAQPYLLNNVWSGLLPLLKK